jgi:hypothetical protein
MSVPAVKCNYQAFHSIGIYYLSWPLFELTDTVKITFF